MRDKNILFVLPDVNNTPQQWNIHKEINFNYFFSS